MRVRRMADRLGDDKNSFASRTRRGRDYCAGRPRQSTIIACFMPRRIVTTIIVVSHRRARLLPEVRSRADRGTRVQETSTHKKDEIARLCVALRIVVIITTAWPVNITSPPDCVEGVEEKSPPASYAKRFGRGRSVQPFPTFSILCRWAVNLLVGLSTRAAFGKTHVLDPIAQSGRMSTPRNEVFGGGRV